MIASCRGFLGIFNPHWISEITGTIEIIEREITGAGIARFESQEPCILIVADKSAPLIWSLSQRKCADGAFFSFDENGVHLHIVELKSAIKLSTWAHAAQQIQGMFLTAMAISRLLHIPNIASVTCYVAGTVDQLSKQATKSASPTLIKTPVGKSTTFGNLEDWTNEILELPFKTNARLKKAWKDAKGIADFGAVS